MCHCVANLRLTQEGFDSHYALVTQASNWQPCAIDEEADADELVVFQKQQVLPRYLVYYSRLRHGLQLAALHPNQPVLAWVDHAHDSPENCAFRKFLWQQSPQTQVVQLHSTAQLKVWLQQHEALLQQLLQQQLLRVMTNRYRPSDGGERAGEELCEWLKQDDNWKSTMVMVYCRDVRAVQHLFNPQRDMGVFVTSNSAHALAFAAMCDDPKQWCDRAALKHFYREHRGRQDSRSASALAFLRHKPKV